MRAFVPNEIALNSGDVYYSFGHLHGTCCLPSQSKYTKTHLSYMGQSQESLARCPTLQVTMANSVLR